jgi:hypothetical protein
MKPVTAILLAVCVSTAGVTFALSATDGHLTTPIAWMALIAGVIAAIIYWTTSGSAGAKMKMSAGDWAASGLFALFALRAFCWLVFYDGDSIKVLSPNNLGDLPLHLTYIRFIAKGAKFWLETPIYAGAKLHYPAGVDIFNAMLKLIGCDDFRALVWVGLAGSAVTCYALLRWGGWFAVMGFLCNGGLAGWKFFHHFAFKLADYQADVDWKSIPLSMFITQRGLLYSIPAGLLLLAVWRARWFRMPDEVEPPLRMPVWVQVTLYATMPLFHLHTFLFLSAVLGWWIITGRTGTRLRLEALDLILWAVLPATVCVSLITGLFQRGENMASVIHLLPGWMQGNAPFFQYWFTNFGVMPVLTLAVVIWAMLPFRKSGRAQIVLAYSTLAVALIAVALLAIFAHWNYRCLLIIPVLGAIYFIWTRLPGIESPRAARAFSFVFPSVAVFGTACVVMFAPWEWDNTKIMIWAYLAVLPFIHEMLLELPTELGLPLRPAAYILLFFSGLVSLLGGVDRTHTGYEIAKRSEVDAVEYATRSIPADATFAGFPTYNHPLLLSGCKLLEGYDGHLFSHGIAYRPRLGKLTAMMRGADQWADFAQQMHVRYLYWGALEQQGYPQSTQPWRDMTVAASGPWGTIYDLLTPAPIH